MAAGARRKPLERIPQGEVYQLIEPGPVVLVCTEAKDGTPNVMTMSWHMMVEFEPPQIACVVSANNHSFAALRRTRECVLALPSSKLASKVVGIGNCSGRDVDKFAAFGLTKLPASIVAPPLIAECFANLECRVVDTKMVKAYNMFILEVVAAWKDSGQREQKTIHHRGYGSFAVDGRMIRQASKMR